MLFGNVIPIPFNPHLSGAGGISGDIIEGIVYWLGRPVEDAEYPNKIGDQDREAAGGEVFPGRALAFDGVDQHAYVADNGALDINQASTDFCFSAKITTGSDITTGQYILGKPVGGAKDGDYGAYLVNSELQILIELNRWSQIS